MAASKAGSQVENSERWVPASWEAVYSDKKLAYKADCKLRIPILINITMCIGRPE